MVFILEMLGTIAFAVSGVQVAIRKQMDLLGVIVLGVTTACGGGIIRDIIAGNTPPAVFREPIYALAALLTSLVFFLPLFRPKLDSNTSLLLVSDAIGLGIFTAIGTRAGIASGNMFLACSMGILTGVGGGVLRDIFAGETPAIFVRHFYACASIAGAFLYVVLAPVSDSAALILSSSLVVILRLAAAHFHWNLPR